MSRPDREKKLDREHPWLSIRRQCTLLSLARSGVYRERKRTSPEELVVMRKIDELFLSHPFLGARRIALMLGQEGFRVNRKRVKRLMRVMGLVALGPKPRTSKPAPGHKIFPYLLKGMKIDRPNQVWAADITYIPMGAAFSISWPSWTGPREQCSPSGSPTPWIPRSALKPWTKRLRAMVRQRSSTPIRAASSPRRLSPTGSSLRTSAFRWTAAGAISTTSSSNGCGAR